MILLYLQRIYTRRLLTMTYFFIAAILLSFAVYILDFVRYSKLKPTDAIQTRYIKVPIINWISLGGKVWILQKHLVKCSDGYVMLPDISQEKYTIGEIRFEESYEMNGVVKGRPISTGIIFKLFGPFWALMNMNRKKKISMKKEELPTNMYIQLIKNDGTYMWLTIGNSKYSDYNDIYMNFR